MKLTDLPDLVNGWYDGPHTPATVEAAAESIHSLVRYLANATSPGNGETTLRHAPQVYQVLRHLTAATGDMDQLLGQISDAAGRHARDSLYDDTDRPATETSADLQTHLANARAELARAARSLDAARAAASHLGHRDVDRDTTV